jgi:TRAP transporter 4TM/12TM fusion protein
MEQPRADSGPAGAAANDDERLSERKVAELIEEFESEARTRRPGPAWTRVIAVLSAALSVYALYWTQYSITTQVYRAAFLMLVLTLTFLLYPMFRRDSRRVPIYDLALVGLTIASLGFLLLNYESALQRSTRPTSTELLMGGLLIVLILEATRRTTGWVLAAVALAFLGYAFFGPSMPEPFDHRGYGLPRIIGKNYLTLEGIFGVPLDVAATFIVLFTIYGAVLEYSGAGKFFIDWAFAALGRTRSGAGPGRTVTAAGFLLGTVSGSGVATTVTLGSLAWPMLKRGGYSRDVAGGILSAAGIGAILSPPTLGAAAFLIAEYLEISYLQVLVMALIPTLLYYLSCLLMIEADSRRMKTKAVEIQTESLWVLTVKYGYHFSSLFAVAFLMAYGMTPFTAVFWSITLAFLLSFLRPETRLTSLRVLGIAVVLAYPLGLLARWLLNALTTQRLPPFELSMRLAEFSFWALMLAALISAAIVLRVHLRGWQLDEAHTRLLRALESGGRGVLSVGATTAAAGVIVSVVTLTGLGLKISGVIVALSGGNVLLTVFFGALAVWVLGLAVPVTASYIIAAVMIVPAFTDVGIPEVAAHMFIFYYAVLADVSPPTALSPFAAAAITGGNPFRTMMLAWKYCLPAFLVPFMFCLSPEGLGLLMIGDPLTIVRTVITGCLAVAALAVAFGGYLLRPASVPERAVMGVGGLALLYADTTFDLVGLVLLGVALVMHLLRTRRSLAEDGPLPLEGA